MFQVIFGSFKKINDVLVIRFLMNICSFIGFLSKPSRKINLFFSVFYLFAYSVFLTQVHFDQKCEAVSEIIIFVLQKSLIITYAGFLITSAFCALGNRICLKRFTSRIHEIYKRFERKKNCISATEKSCTNILISEFVCIAIKILQVIASVTFAKGRPNPYIFVLSFMKCVIVITYHFLTYILGKKYVQLRRILRHSFYEVAKNEIWDIKKIYLSLYEAGKMLNILFGIQILWILLNAFFRTLTTFTQLLSYYYYSNDKEFLLEPERIVKLVLHMAINIVSILVFLNLCKKYT